METPGSTATLVRVGRANANWLNTSPTWDASSRVGTSTRTLGSPLLGALCKAWSKGRAKGGFPGTGLGTGQDIASFQHRWNGRCLHRRGRSETTGHSGLGKCWG